MKKSLTFVLVFLVILPMLALSCVRTSNASWNFFFQGLDDLSNSGQMPENSVVFMDGLRAPQFMAANKLKPIPADWIRWPEFDPRLVRYFQRGGQNYVVPINAQTVVLAANRKLLDSAGLRVPTTWDDLLGAAEKLTRPKDGVFGVGFPPAFWSILPFIYQAGGALTNPQNTAVTLNTPEVEKAYTFYTDFYLKGLCFPGRNTPFPGEWPFYGMYDQNVDAFASGKIGMLIVGPDMADEIVARMKLNPATQDEVVLAQLPAGPGGKRATIATVRGFGLWGGGGAAPNDATRRFLQFATSPEGMSFWRTDARNSVFLPARPTLQSEWGGSHLMGLAFLASVEYIQPVGPFPLLYPDAAAFSQRADATTLQVLQGKLTVKAALETLQKDASQVLSRSAIK